jgi:hypothetical protein
LAFDNDSESEILEWMKVQIEKYKTITRKNLRHYYEAKYFRLISRGWVNSFILRHRGDLTKTKSTPQ